MKKIFALLMMTAVMLSMSGCKDYIGDWVDSNKKELKKSSQEEDSQATIPEFPKIEPIEVPEGGWTEETLNEVIYVDGNQIHLPVKYDGMGEHISTKWYWSKETEIDSPFDKDKRVNKTVIPIYYDTEFIGNVGYLLDLDNETNLSENDISVIVFFLDDGKEELYSSLVSVNSVTFGSSEADVKQYLGEENLATYTDEDNVTCYQYTVGKIIVYFEIENDSVKLISFMYA